MQTVLISTSAHVVPTSNLALLMKDLEEAKKQRMSRIFRTYVTPNTGKPKRFVLVTTSKDLHLKIGSLGSGFHYHFAKFLEEEFTKRKCMQFLLVFQEKPDEDKEGVLVTMTSEGDDTIFTLSPAH